MTWPIPAPGVVSNRAAGAFEIGMAAVYLARTGQHGQVDARSPYSTLAVYGRVIEMSATDLYLDQSRIADEMMVDTAQDWLYRHGNLWGVPQVQPSAAAGSVLVSANTAIVIPAGAALSVGGAQYTVSAATAIPGTSVLTELPIVAVTKGSAGDLATSTVLTFTNPIAGLVAQTAVADSNGITGGEDLESPDSWRGRIIKRIQNRGTGGSAADYVNWVQDVIPTAMVQVTCPGLNVVVIAVAIPVTGGIPRVPTVTELAELQAYITDLARKPLTAQVNVIAATLTPVPITLHEIPNTVAIQTGATSAILQFFNLVAVIGGGIAMSALDAAISAGSGETAHDRTAPAADIAGVTNVLLVPALPVTFD